MGLRLPGPSLGILAVLRSLCTFAGSRLSTHLGPRGHQAGEVATGWPGGRLAAGLGSSSYSLCPLTKLARLELKGD